MKIGSKALLIVTCLLAIASSGFWIFRDQRKGPEESTALHRRVGEVLAEQTARLVGQKGKVVIIAMDTSGEPELKTQLEAFRAKLKVLGAYEFKDQELDTKDQPKYGVGNGLSARRFVRIVKKNAEADAIVSFVGAPKFSEEDFIDLKKRPKFVAESRGSDHLPPLFDNKLIEVAVVSRFVFPAPGPIDPTTPQEWFDKRYQILTAESAASIPKPD
jgi:hypothetical protein